MTRRELITDVNTDIHAVQQQEDHLTHSSFISHKNSRVFISTL